jgi:AsmA protein
VIVKNLFKRVATSLIAVVTLFSAAIIYILLAVDINSYKTDIESLASQQGWNLAIDGDLAWKFLPQPGISIQQVSFSDQVAASGSLHKLSLSVAWTDLFSIILDPNQLKVSSVEINGGQLSYTSPDSFPVQLDNISLSARNIRLDSTEFPLTASMQALGGQQLAVDTYIAVVIGDGTVQSLSLSDLTVHLNDIEINGSVEASNSLSFIEGNLQTNSFSLLQQLQRVAEVLPIVGVPELANPSALTDVSIESRFSFDTKALSDISNLINLDGQAITIDLQIDQPRNKLTTVISADIINASNYLPKPGSGADNSGLFAPLAIPLALWQGQSQVEMTLGKVQFNDFAVDNFYSNVFGNSSVLRLTSLNADLFGGQINGTGRLDMRSATPEFELQNSLTDIDLELALPAIADNSDLQGLFSLEVELQGSGNSSEEIISALTGQGELTVLNPVYLAINAEETFCNAAALFGGSPTNTVWSKGTELETLTSQFSLDDGKVLIRDLKTATGNLSISGRGTVQLLLKRFSVTANTRVNASTTSPSGCSVNKSLRNRNLPFICTGSFDVDGKTNCKPDDGLVRDFLKGNIFQQLGGQLFDTPVTEKDSGDQQEADPLKSLLKGVLEKKLK